MASDPKPLQAELEAAVPDVPLTFKPMFGGIMGYADGKPVASLSNVGLALKLVRAEEQERLLAIKGAKRLQYEPSMPPSKTYIVVPSSVMKDGTALRGWVMTSIECNKASQKRAPKRRGH